MNLSNRDGTQAQLTAYRAEIDRLRSILKDLLDAAAQPVNAGSTIAWIDAKERAYAELHKS